MLSKDGSQAVSSQRVQTTMPQPSLSGQTGDCSSGTEYLFQPPMTVTRPQIAREEYKNEWKRISCDFCRRRKIKCDKGDPCGQCSISFRDCMYSQCSKRGPKRSKCSSSKLDAMDKRPKVIESDRFYTSPAIDTMIITSSSSSPSAKRQLEDLQTSPRNLMSTKTDFEEIGKCATAHHVIEEGGIEFHGTSADRAFMEELMEKLGDRSVTPQRIPVDASVPGLFQSDARCFDEVLLPERDQAAKLVEAALDAQVLLHILHRPSFDSSFNWIYSLIPHEYGLKEKNFLPLLYAVLAYGSLFLDPHAERLEYDEVIRRASRYFIKSKQLQDIASCNNLVSLQAIVFQNLFLIYTTRTPLCYTYLCTSMSVALRMGLHRSFHDTQDAISTEIGKRVFWALKLLSSEVATCVGLPALVNDEDSDQELPLEVNDAYIQEGKAIVQPSIEVCYASGSICYSRLHGILHKVLKDIYPRKGRASAEACGSMKYIVKVDTIREIEKELENWAKMIPLGYRLGSHYQEPALKRPFLHYDIETEQNSLRQNVGLSPYASACIQACQNIIELCEDICRWGLLTEASWPAIRILTSCMLTLLYITIMHKNPHEDDMLFKALATGRKILHIMEKRSLQARRSKTIFKIITSSLSIKFEHIREKLVKYELEAPNFRHKDPSSVNEETTALLGEKVFTLSSKGYLRNFSPEVLLQNGLKHDTVRPVRLNNVHRELKDASLLQPHLFSYQSSQGNTPIGTVLSLEALSASPRIENSIIKDSSERSHASWCFIPSAPRPTPGSSFLAGPTMGLHQEEPRGSWIHAFESTNNTGSVYSAVKDQMGGTSPQMDDINEFSDIWDWF
ncbi:fungal-specific transcription factor domain-containing protein [Trichoderma barbatum]